MDQRVTELEAAVKTTSDIIHECTSRMARINSRSESLHGKTQKQKQQKHHQQEVDPLGLAPPPVDKVEADTAAAEEVDLNALLLPDGKLPLDVSNFGLW